MILSTTVGEVFRESLLRDKHAFLTGGGSGICLAVAERFAAHGAAVSLLGRSQEKLDRAVADIQSRGGAAAGFSADVRHYDALAAAVQSARNLHGELDILICGAAGNLPAPAIGMSANGFKAVIDIDVLGTFNTCRAAYDHLRKPGACIINISAPQASRAMAFQVHVCAAKAGVDQITRTLALEWGPAGIRVNSLVPGAVDDTEGMRRLAPDDRSRARVMRSIPLGRLARKADIADLALFLCSDAAEYITGATLVCDGGHSASGGSF